MEKYKIISFNGSLSKEQAEEMKTVLETHKIYREYITDGAVVIILKIKKHTATL